VEMSYCSLCVITMMMVKLQLSFYATSVEIYVLTATDSFIFIVEPKLTKDRWKFLSLYPAQDLDHEVHLMNFKVNVEKNGKKWAVTSVILAEFPAGSLTNCKLITLLNFSRLTFTFIKIGNIWNFLQCFLNESHY
jgi:hypothetical protein